MIGISKINLAISILFITLLGYLIKYIFGLEFGTFLPDILLLILILILFINYNSEIFILQKNKYYYFLFFYLILHFTIFSIIAYKNSEFRLVDLTDYRNFFRGFILFFILTSTKYFRNHKVVKKLIKALEIYTFLIFFELIFEFVLNKIFNMDLTFLPWSSNNITKNASDMAFGIADSNARLITFFGWPHQTSLIANSLFFFWFWFYLNNKTKKNLGLVLCSLITLFLAESRLQILIFLLIISFNLIYFFPKYYKKIKSFLRLFIILFGTLVFIYYFNYFQFSSEKSFLLFYEYLSEGYYNNLLDFIEIPSNILVYFFGIGTFGGSANWGSIWDIAKIESGLITEFLPKYGFVFLFIYIKLFLEFKNKLSQNKKILFFCLVPFLLAPLHFWLLNQTGVSDYFFFISSIIYLININYEY